MFAFVRAYLNNALHIHIKYTCERFADAGIGIAAVASNAAKIEIVENLL